MTLCFCEGAIAFATSNFALQPENCEDNFDFEDFWTVGIVPAPAIVSKTFTPWKKIPQEQTVEQNLRNRRKKLVLERIFDENQNINGYIH